MIICPAKNVNPNLTVANPNATESYIVEVKSWWIILKQLPVLDSPTNYAFVATLSDEFQ
jgi:hypothetical protein